jgi:uncharacterized protein (UPF0332 family)
MRALQTARRLAKDDPDAASSRAYYAEFHAVSALFARRGQSFSKHTAIRAAIHRDLVRTGHWPRELGLAYDLLLDLRETADYGGLSEVSTESALQAVQSADQIVAGVLEQCPDLGPKNGG